MNSYEKKLLIVTNLLRVVVVIAACLAISAFLQILNESGRCDERCKMSQDAAAQPESDDE